MIAALPIVGVSACRNEIAPHTYHVVMDKYLAAVRDAAGAVPLIVPADGEHTRSEAIVDTLDGLVLTGGYSNVEPRRYNGTNRDAEALHELRTIDMPHLKAALTKQSQSQTR